MLQIENVERVEQVESVEQSQFSLLVYIIAWFGVLFKKNSPSNYSKRKIGPSPKDEGLFSFE